VNSLRSYFNKPGKGGFWKITFAGTRLSGVGKPPFIGFFKSSKRNYALWLYYHRLDKDLLFKALVNYVEPKIRLEINRVENPSYPESHNE